MFDKIANRSQDVGKDPSFMGRWSWIQVKGKDNIQTRIYSVYRPCRGQGERTVYSQQLRALLRKDDQRCPQQAFWEDLQINVQQAKDGGNQIIVGGDFNCNMAGPEAQ